MNTTDVIKKHEDRFNRTRAMVKVLLLFLIATIAFLQWNNIAQLLKWIWANI